MGRMLIQDILSQNNIVIQEGAYTCGPCTILNVLRLKGDLSFSESELSELCEAKPCIGTTNEKIVDVVKKVGLDAIEEKRDSSLLDIERNLDQGAYVIVCYTHAFAGEGHYAVIASHDENAFYLVDPSFGFLRLRKEYLEKFWFNSDSSIHGWYLAVQ
jgi:predicted double-glycine peptidase